MSSEPNRVDTKEPAACKCGFSIVGAITVALGLVLVGSLIRDYSRDAQSGGLSALAATQPSLAKLASADQLYQQDCAICHGPKGEGDGPAAPVLQIHPRNFAGLYAKDRDSGKIVFKPGRYRFVTSNNQAPFKDDIIRTIRHGLAGTSMPSWQDLSDKQVEELADYVLEISRVNYRRAVTEKFADQRAKKKTQAAFDKFVDGKVDDMFVAEGKVNPGPEPETFTDADLLAARTAFANTCAGCHGPDGRGMVNAEWYTDEGYTGEATASRNFRGGVFKAGGKGIDIYSRIYSGIPGTVMPAFTTLSDKEIWQMVHYIQRMAAPEGQEADVFKVKTAAADSTTPSEKAVATVSAGKEVK